MCCVGGVGADVAVRAAAGVSIVTVACVSSGSSQAIGAENYKLAGVWFQQTLLWFSVVCVGIACLWLETEDVLLALGFSRRSCELAGEFSR